MSRITQKGATGALSLQANGAFQTSTDGDFVTYIGSRWDTSDGRELVLVSAATTALAAGKLMQNAPVLADHQNLTTTAFTAYSANGNIPAKVTVTLGGTQVSANQYRGGFVVTNASTGLGQTLRIASHPAAVAAASLAITLEDGPNTALTTSTKVSLLPPPATNVIINPTTPTNVPCGVAICAIPASSYGFLVTKGLTSCLSDATAPGVGVAISASTVTAGAIASVPAILSSGLVGATIIGNTIQAAVSAEYRTVFVNL